MAAQQVDSEPCTCDSAGTDKCLSPKDKCECTCLDLSGPAKCRATRDKCGCTCVDDINACRCNVQVDHTCVCGWTGLGYGSHVCRQHTNYNP